MRIFIGFLCLVLMTVSACSEKKQVTFTEYKGPQMEVYNIASLYSDSGRSKILLNAPKELEYQNGDQDFPDGIYLEFFDEETGKKASTLKGNKGKFVKDKNVYVVTGNVIVKSLTEKKKLNSEELVWKPDEKKITSDKFVRIETPCEILTGDGLISNEDFSSYQILKPKANIFLDCE